MEVIGAALERGINLVNSASFYGSGHNEKLLGKAIKKFGREKFFIVGIEGFVVVLGRRFDLYRTLSLAPSRRTSLAKFVTKKPVKTSATTSRRPRSGSSLLPRSSAWERIMSTATFPHALRRTFLLKPLLVRSRNSYRRARFVTLD